MLNPFLNWSRQDLETALRSAQQDLAAGKTTTRAGDSNILVQSAVDTRPEVRVRRILLALHKLAPDDYPIDQITPITTARISFGQPQVEVS